MSTLVQVRDLQLSRGDQQLFSDLELSIAAGDHIGLVGHNGCGKLSLLSLLARREAPDSGRVGHANRLALAVVEQFSRCDRRALRP